MNQRTWPRYASLASILVIGVAALTLLGWEDRGAGPAHSGMRLVTAWALLAAAASLLLQVAPIRSQRMQLARTLALPPLALGALGLLPQLARLDLSPATAACLMLCGGALWLLGDLARRTTVRVLGSCVLAIALLSGVGDAFDLAELYAADRFRPMALHSLLAFGLLGTGLLASPQAALQYRYRDWSVKTKLVGMLVVASLAPLLLFALLEVRAVARQLLERQGALLGARADQLADELDDFQREQASVVAQLAAAASVLDRAQASDQLLGLTLRASPDVLGAALFAADGHLQQLAGASPPDAARSSELQAALAGTPAASELHVARLAGVESPVLAYAAPIRTGGAVMTWVRASALWQLMTNHNGLAGPLSFAVLLDPDGVRIAHSYKQAMVFHPAGPLAPDALARAVSRQRFGAGTRALLQDVQAFPEAQARALAREPDGRMFRGFAPATSSHTYNVGRRLHTMPWTLFYVIPEASVQAQVAPHTRNRSWFAALFGTLALALGAVVASGIVRPLQRLSEATARVGSEGPGARVDVDSRDELGVLAERWNRMTERIEAQAAELRRMNEELELRVQQRTAQLQEREQDLAITLDSIGDAVITTDREGHIERMNPQAERLTGWAASAARGHSLDEVYVIASEDTGEACASPVTRVIREGVVVGLANHTVLLPRAGEPCPIADSAAPIFGTDGALRGVVLVFRDVREERHAQLQLQASEARYRELYETHPDMCATVDPRTERILEHNLTLASKLGFAREELRDKLARELYAPESIKAGEEARAVFLQTYELNDQERTLLRKDGSRLETSLNVNSVHDSRGVARVKMVWRDISLRKQTERDQRLLSELSELPNVTQDARELIGRVCTRLAEYLGAARGSFVEIDDAHDRFSVERDYHRELPSMVGEYALSAFSDSTRREQQSGLTTALDDVRLDPRTAAQHATAWEPLGIRAGVAVPLIREGHWVASLFVGHDTPRAWQPREIALIRAIAERAWLWIEHMRLRAELHAQETRELSRRNEQRFHALLDSVTDYAIYLLDPQGRVTSWNRGAQRIKGYGEAEVIGQHFSLFYAPEDRVHADEALERARSEGRFEEDAWRLRKDGSRFWANAVITPLYDAQGCVEAFAKVTRDHSERRRSEEALQKRQEQLATSLREREVLLQEVHHRVKNNLQVISSLLSMQMRQVNEPRTRDALEESRRRVEAIALIHEKLYQSVDYSKVQFSEYVSTLAANVFHAAGSSPARVKLELLVEPVSLAVDKAIPCGLVLNELITNTLKHGFPERRQGTVRVELRKHEHGDVLLAVADDGVGMPADFDPDKSRSLGMQLVTTLVQQLRGQLEIIRAPGTTFRIRVPVEVRS